MTISSTTLRKTATGDGSSTAFTFPYRFLANADLKVYQEGTLKTITTHYTVTGAGDAGGGTVTFVVAPADEDEIVILNDPSPTQSLDLVDNDPFPAESLEAALDRIILVCQRLKDRVDRAMVLSDTDITSASTTLPTPEANQLVGWNSDGDELINIDPNDIATIVAAGNFQYQLLSGTGAQTAFTLNQNPGSLGNLDVAIGGVVQRPVTDYTFSGTTLTFAAAPASGTDNILVRWGAAAETGSHADASVGTSTLIDLAVTAGKLAATLDLSGKTLTMPVAYTPVFTKSYTSTNQTVSPAGALTLAHSLGAAPKQLRFSLVCLTGEFNWSVGDVIEVSPQGQTTSGFAAYSDTTNVYVRFSDNATVFDYLNKTTGSNEQLSNANWALVVRAWA